MSFILASRNSVYIICLFFHIIAVEPLDKWRNHCCVTFPGEARTNIHYSRKGIGVTDQETAPPKSSICKPMNLLRLLTEGWTRTYLQHHGD